MFSILKNKKKITKAFFAASFFSTAITLLSFSPTNIQSKSSGTEERNMIKQEDALVGYLGKPGVIENLGFEFLENPNNGEKEFYWSWKNSEFEEYRWGWEKRPILELTYYDSQGIVLNKELLSAERYGFDSSISETGDEPMHIPFTDFPFIDENVVEMHVQMHFIPDGNLSEPESTPVTEIELPFNKSFSFVSKGLLKNRIVFDQNSIVAPPDLVNAKTIFHTKYFDYEGNLIEQDAVDVTTELPPTEDFYGKEYVINHEQNYPQNSEVSEVRYYFYMQNDDYFIPLYKNYISLENNFETHLSRKENDVLEASIRKKDHYLNNDEIKYIGINTDFNSNIPDVGTIKSIENDEVTWESGVDFNLNTQIDETVVLNFVLLDDNNSYVDKISRVIYFGDILEPDDLLEFNDNGEMEYADEGNLLIENSTMSFDLFLSDEMYSYSVKPEVASFYLNDKNISNKATENNKTSFNNVLIPEEFDYGTENVANIELKDKHNRILFSEEQDINIINVNDRIYKEDDTVFVEIDSLKGVDKIVIKNNDEIISVYDNFDDSINLEIEASESVELSIEYYTSSGIHSTQIKNFEVINNTAMSTIGIVVTALLSTGAIFIITTSTMFIIRRVKHGYWFR